MIDFTCKQPDLDEVFKCAFGLTKADLQIMKFFFRKSTKQVTSQLISKKLKFQETTVQKAVRKLFDKGIILREAKNLKNGGYVFYYELNDRRKIYTLLSKLLKTWNSKIELKLKKDLLI